MTFESPPEWLASFGQIIWPEVVEQLRTRDRLSVVQPAQVAVFCQALAQYRLVTLQLNTEGQTLVEEHELHNVLKLHPAFRAQQALIQQLRLLIEDLGLNAPQEDPAATALDQLADWLERARSSGALDG